MWSTALDTILTTLRYLAPATLLTLFWGQQGFLFKILKHIDLAFRAIVFSSNEQKESVLKWLAEAGPVRIEHLDTVWRHGWILCGVLDNALPGACAGHPPIRLSLKHAQTIAEQYLAVESVFTDNELESSDCLSRHQEWKLAHYLDRIRLALAKLPPPVSKPNSQRTSPDFTQFTFDYTARGSGLSAAQISNKMYFKIYPTAQQSLEPGEITVLIKGPKDTYGMAVIPPLPGKAQLLRQKLLDLDKEPQYTEPSLPLTQGATYLRNFGKNDMKRAYHIPKTKYDIEIEVILKSDHAKVGYEVNLEGRHEISITSRGQNIVGSPFVVSASKNIVGNLERESFCLEDGEEIDIVDVKTDKKIVLRIVDFVTEKMLLKEDGILEKISDNEAKLLMSTEDKCSLTIPELPIPSGIPVTEDEITQIKIFSLKHYAIKIAIMIRICKIFKSNVGKSKFNDKNNKIGQSNGIPDIVNSTLCDRFVKRNEDKTTSKYVVPENIAVSLHTEKNIYHEDQKEADEFTSVNIDNNIVSATNKFILTANKGVSSSNPFLNEIQDQSFVTEADDDMDNLFIKPNTHNIIENESIPVKIFVEDASSIGTTPSPNNNPFIDPEVIERPKTPVLKIISGELTGRDESVYLDPRVERIAEEILCGNEFINPFFIHQHPRNIMEPVADFIIGAPVSLPPIVRAPTPEVNMESIMITARDEENNTFGNDKNGEITESTTNSVFSTPEHGKADVSINSSIFHSLDEDASEKNSQNSFNVYAVPSKNTNNQTLKDMWDSAYVSIEDSSSPDTNYNESPVSDPHAKNSRLYATNDMDFCNMGPAELELWETCNELSEEVPKVSEETRVSRWEYKRPKFTPIIEESDRSLSTGLKDLHLDGTPNINENDPVSAAFAELNDVFHEYSLNSEPSSLLTCTDDKSMQSTETNYNMDRSVESASADLSDVMRTATDKQEGKISEVQTNAAESVSVSQSLRQKLQNRSQQYKKPFHFGDEKPTNIVLEKKQFWDERIRQNEELMAEQQKNKRVSSKSMKNNDSLTRRKGKQIIKNFLQAGESTIVSDTVQVSNTPSPIQKIECEKILVRQPTTEQEYTDIKLVEKWKRYWDEKLQNEEEEKQEALERSKSPRLRNTPSPKRQDLNITAEDVDEPDSKTNISNRSSPVKQEVPEEIMFQAFETSPKRFFGTSRKQILNKIDAFLGKPNNQEEILKETKDTRDKSIVSSRIDLFRNISQIDESPRQIQRYHSMQNIVQNDTEAVKRIQEEIKEIMTKNKELKLEEKSVLKEQVHSNEKSVLLVSTSNDSTNKNDTIKCDLPKDPWKEKRIGFANIKTSEQREPKINKLFSLPQEENFIRRTVLQMNKTNEQNQVKTQNNLKKTSVSKSEMDIFTKVQSEEIDDLDKYKSFDELPTANVKNFISLYETVSKSSLEPSVPRRMSRTKSITSVKELTPISSNTEADKKITENNVHHKIKESLKQVQDQTKAIETPVAPPRKKRGSRSSSQESMSRENIESSARKDDIKECLNEPSPLLVVENTYLSLSEIELEIIDHSPDLIESSPHKEMEAAVTGYKTRFNMAKQFFQSLDELRADDKKKEPSKPNECEQTLTESNESLENKRSPKRVKKNIKAYSLPSSELSKIWDEMKESDPNKLIKISEKFNVDDLFNDVVEGKLSRQGSLRGIPNKKAVLETFKSMENVSDSKLSPYEIAASQLNEFAKENKIKNAQTHLTEYPYLPTTDPSKYHSRLDARASGLISMKELYQTRPRRNSVPDMPLNAKFTADL